MQGLSWPNRCKRAGVSPCIHCEQKRRPSLATHMPALPLRAQVCGTKGRLGVVGATALVVQLALKLEG